MGTSRQGQAFLISDFFAGARFALKGLRLLFTRGIRRYVIVPLLINMLLFGAAIGFGADRFNALLDWLLPAWFDWARWVLWPLFALAGLLIVFYTFTLLANLISAPFNAYLSLRLEQRLGAAPTNAESQASVLGEALKSIGGEIRKIGYALRWAIPLLVLFLVPVANVLAPFAWAVFGAWTLANEYADYPMSNAQLDFASERVLLRGNRSLALGFGAMVMVLTIIPVLNFVMVPAGVAGATAMWVEKLRAG